MVMPAAHAQSRAHCVNHCKLIRYNLGLGQSSQVGGIQKYHDNLQKDFETATYIEHYLSKTLQLWSSASK